MQAPGAKGLSGPEALKEIKKGIPAAIAVYILKSSDIDAFVLTKAVRDKVLSALYTEGIKVLKRDF